jgi:hypothetical protein
LFVLTIFVYPRTTIVFYQAKENVLPLSGKPFSSYRKKKWSVMVAQTSGADIANTRFAQEGQQYEETSQAEKRFLHDQTEIIRGGNGRHNRAYPKSFAQMVFALPPATPVLLKGRCSDP